MLGPGSICSFLILCTMGRAPLTGDQQVAGRYLHTEHKQNRRTHKHPCRVGLELTIPVFERAKIVHAFNRAATVTGHK
jgi:hypothetical protein